MGPVTLSIETILFVREWPEQTPEGQTRREALSLGTLAGRLRSSFSSVTLRSLTELQVLLSKSRVLHRDWHPWHTETMSTARVLSDSTITRELGEHVCERVTKDVVKALQEMDTALLSGDDSGLTSTWDELCVQLQYEQSCSWDVYEESVREWVAGLVQDLPSFEQDAAWMVTTEGQDWECEDEDDRDCYPVCMDDIVEHIVINGVFEEARFFTSNEISQYLARQFE